MLKLVFSLTFLLNYIIADEPIDIIRVSQDFSPDGNFQWDFESDNGIKAVEQGTIKGTGDKAGIAIQGEYFYTSPEGEKIAVSYVADEEGFKPSNLPTPPPVPEAIQKALDWIAAHPEKGKKEEESKFDD